MGSPLLEAEPLSVIEVHLLNVGTQLPGLPLGMEVLRHEAMEIDIL